MINGAFRRKAKEYHPDLIRNNPATAEAFKALVKARDEALAIAASGG
jgi:curved DNA-binding protein CbpA